VNKRATKAKKVLKRTSINVIDIISSFSFIPHSMIFLLFQMRLTQLIGIDSLKYFSFRLLNTNFDYFSSNHKNLFVCCGSVIDHIYIFCQFIHICFDCGHIESLTIEFYDSSFINFNCLLRTISMPCAHLDCL
jgi:hypothetical protein